MKPDPRTDLDARLEAEIQAALGDMSLEDMLDQPRKPSATQSGEGRDTRSGTVVAIHGDDVFIEFGPKSQGVCSISHFEAPPTRGEQYEFIVERFDRNEGLLMLSRAGAVLRADFASLEVGQVVEARCTGTNKGGLEMDVAGHSAFMPAGQVDLRHVDDLGIFVGEKIPCEVIEFDPSKRRIILSRRSFLAAERARTAEKMLETLEVGQEITGVVSSLQPYGCFVDLGGVDGLAHISDLSHSRINHPKEIVKEGERITVKVLKIDRDTDPPRISLGVKQTMTDPFQSSAESIREGATLSGRVTRVMPFGAFVEIAPGVEGLIHISELSHDRVNRVESIVKPDEVVTVKVLSVDLDQKRIGLSLKAARAEHEAAQPRQDDPSMAKMRAKLKSKFGDDSLKGGLG